MIADYTVQYYEDNAESFVNNTINVDMSEVYNRLLSHNPTKGKLLDVGCGSGRDSKYFMSIGFDVDPIDRSEAIAKIASQHIGKPVRVTNLLDIEQNNDYDVVWASASLVHISKFTLPYAFNVIANCLKENGLVYCSFKYGTHDGIKNGRYFCYLTEKTFKDIIEKVPSLQLIDIWLSYDKRPERSNELWLNAILTKQ